MVSQEHKFSGERTETSAFEMATSAEDSLDKVRAQLICSICRDLLSEPKKLDCDHSFCQSCLENHIQTLPQPDPVDTPKEPHARVLECACCQQATYLPDKGVEGLKTNLKLKSLVEILSALEREETVQALGKGHHLRGSQSRLKCEEHGENCSFFCQDCNTLFCRHCIPQHKDPQHKWDNYETFLFQHKEELQWSIQPAYEAAQSAHDAMQELEKDKDAVVQNRDSVKGKVRDYFSQLAAELQEREQTIIKMADRYAEAKMENLQKHYNQLQKGHLSLLQNIEKIETQMQEDSAELLTRKDSIKTKMLTHRNTIHSALPKSEDVDTFIELKVESQVPIDTLGHLVFCQKNPRTGLVSTVRNFVLSKDMEHIHLDLARPSDHAIAVPDYIQFRYAQQMQTDEDLYVDVAPAMPIGQSQGHSKRISAPLPPVPFGQGAEDSSVAEDVYTEVGGATTSRKWGESEEDPYDTIPGYASSLSSPKSRPNLSSLPRGQQAPAARPDLVQPLEVIDLQNSNVRVSGIICTQNFHNLVITDTNNQCLRILHEGTILHTFGPPDINFCKPVALAINSANDIFVLDQGTKTIYKLQLNGELLFSFSTKPRKGPEKPWDIAISPDDTVYISDWSKRRVYVYNSQDGRKIRSIKGCYKREKKDEFIKFSRPAGVAFDRGGRLMITDRGEKCVWCINTEGDELIKKIGEGHLQNPYGIGVTKNGKIIVTESESDCISVFGENGELLQYFGGTGAGEGLLCRPHHVFVDEREKIFVADTQNKRIQIFAPPEETGVYQNLI